MNGHRHNSEERKTYFGVYTWNKGELDYPELERSIAGRIISVTKVVEELQLAGNPNLGTIWDHLQKLGINAVVIIDGQWYSRDHWNNNASVI